MIRKKNLRHSKLICSGCRGRERDRISSLLMAADQLTARSLNPCFACWNFGSIPGGYFPIILVRHHLTPGASTCLHVCFPDCCLSQSPAAAFLPADPTPIPGLAQHASPSPTRLPTANVNSFRQLTSFFLPSSPYLMYKNVCKTLRRWTCLFYLVMLLVV